MTIKPESVGMCSARLARIDRFLSERYIESGRLPCAQLQVMRDGQLVHQSVLGKASLETGAAMTEDTLVRIYSMTKPITSVAFMMLVEEGKVALDDPVHRFIPEWRDLGVYVAGLPGAFQTRRTDSPMRMIDLLRHTSGLTYAGRARGPVADQIRAAQLGNRNETNQTFVDKLSRTPLMFSPGNRWEYGVSTDVLGRLVEVISGKPLGEFLEERIFKPLGMVDTAFWVPPAKLARAAQPWQRPGGPAMTPRFDVAIQPRFESGGGGLTGTAADYLRFATMLLNGGELNGQRLLGKKSVEFMTADHTGALPGLPPGLSFGLGFQVRRQAGIAGLPGSAGEYGWAGNAGTLFWIDPVEDISVVFLTQFMPSNLYPIRRELRTLVNASVLDSKA